MGNGTNVIFPPGEKIKLQSIFSNANMSKLADISKITLDTKISVVMGDDKIREMSVRELGAILAPDLKSANLNPLKILQDYYGGRGDGNKDIKKLYPGLFDDATLESLRNGGGADFIAKYNSTKNDPDSLAAFLLAHVISKFENCEEAPLFSLQEAKTVVNLTGVIDTSAALKCGETLSDAIRETEVVDSKGESKISIKTLGDKRLGICSTAKKNFYNELCVAFNTQSSINTGATVDEAYESAGNYDRTQDPEARARQFFGNKFVDRMNYAIANAFDKYVEARLSGSEPSIVSLIINELQMRDSIKTIKETSDFVNDFLADRRKDDDRRSGFA
ncbi:MAG: hypothetical protein WC588_04685 [Candidatus Micrarchaeia archaeon]